MFFVWFKGLKKYEIFKIHQRIIRHKKTMRFFTINDNRASSIITKENFMAWTKPMLTTILSPLDFSLHFS